MPFVPSPPSRPTSSRFRGHQTLLATLLLAGCNAGDGLLLPGGADPAAIQVVHGDGLSGRVGEPLNDSVVVQVTNSTGRPVEGASVAFELISAAPGAEIEPATATTDAEGHTHARMVLGTRMGPQIGQARVVVAEGSEAPRASFTVTALSEHANGMAAVSGDGQRGPAGSVLGEPLVVEVTDAFGNPISGVAISWTVEGGGTVSEATVNTDSEGRASVERQLGPAAGPQGTLASSEGLAGSPVTFTHTATAGNVSDLSIVSGNNQTAVAGTRLPADLVVRLVDANGNPVQNRAVTWVVGTGGGSVTPENGITDDAGRSSAQWTLGPNPGDNRIDAVVSGVGFVTFRATGTRVGPIPTVTTITRDAPEPSVAGSVVTVDFQVTSSGGTPTGSVTVSVSGATPPPPCTVSLSNGTGSCQFTLSVVGNRTFTAVYSGGSGFAGSQDTEPHVVVPANPSNRAPDADYNWHCEGLTCAFTDASSDPDGQVTGWSWNFGDGRPGSNERNPSHTFPGPGEYQVTLTVTDNGGATDQSTAGVDVEAPPPTNQPPTAGDDAATTDAGAPVTINVLANDNDPEGAPLTVTSVSDPANGSAVNNGNGTITYTPDPGFNGANDSFTYVVSDGALTDQATVTVTVNAALAPPNTAPSFNLKNSDLSANVSEARTEEGWAENISPGPSSESSQTVAFLLSTDRLDLFSDAPSISPAGTLTFTTGTGEGDSVVSVQLQDNGGTANGGVDTSAPQTFTIHISGGGDD